MLFYNPKLIFIHVSKTGGSSTAKYIRQYEYTHLFERDPRFNNHVTLQSIHDAGIDVSEYRVFTVVRNPWERMVSFYIMCSRNQSFNFPTEWDDFPRKQYVRFPQFYEYITPDTPYCEDYFHYLEVDGIIPKHVEFVDYNNLETEVVNFCDSMGWPRLDNNFPKNKRLPNISTLKRYFMADPDYIETISVKYKREIEYFGFKPPK